LHDRKLKTRQKSQLTQSKKSKEEVMLKRTATVLFFVTVFAIGGLGCGSKSKAEGDRIYYKKSNRLKEYRNLDFSRSPPPYASVPKSKRVVLKKKDGSGPVEICIDYKKNTGCPDNSKDPYECDSEIELPLDEYFVIGSTNPAVDAEGPSAPLFIGDINSDMQCPVGKVVHNPCQWVLISGYAFGPYCWQ